MIPEEAKKFPSRGHPSNDLLHWARRAVYSPQTIEMTIMKSPERFPADS